METEIKVDRPTEHNGDGNHDEGEKLTLDDFRRYLSKLTDSSVDRERALLQARSAVRLYYPGHVRAERIRLMVGGNANPELVKEAEHQLDQCIEVAVRGAIEH